MCCEAVYLPVNMELYQKVSDNIWNIIKEFSPKAEKVSVDEAYLDLSHLSFKEAEKIGKEIKNKIIKKEKLTSTVGIGPNKLISKIACSEAKPDGFKIIIPSKAKGFLSPLPIKSLPGIGPKTAEKLKSFKTIKDLRSLNRKELQRSLGKNGLSIYEKARGIDKREIKEKRDVKSIGKEYTFLRDTRDPQELFSRFEKIISSVSLEIKERNLSYKTITVVCRFSGFETHSKSKTFKKTKDLKLLNKEAKKLFLKFIVENLKPIRLIGLRVKI